MVMPKSYRTVVGKTVHLCSLTTLVARWQVQRDLTDQFICRKASCVYRTVYVLWTAVKILCFRINNGSVHNSRLTIARSGPGNGTHHLLMMSL